jgi:hypothetical protein
MFIAQCLRAGGPRPYLDKKFSVVQVEGGDKTVDFHARYLNFQNITKTVGGFWKITLTT